MAKILARNGRERDGAILWYRPDKARILAEIVRQQGLAWVECCSHFVNRRRLRIEIGIGQELPVDLLLGLAIGAHFLDGGIDRADRLVVALV
jgi:hypothetical protein